MLYGLKITAGPNAGEWVRSAEVPGAPRLTYDREIDAQSAVAGLLARGVECRVETLFWEVAGSISLSISERYENDSDCPTAEAAAECYRIDHAGVQINTINGVPHDADATTEFNF